MENNINVIISQRLKLAEKDLAKESAPDLNTVIGSILFRDRKLDQSQRKAERRKLALLYHKSRMSVNSFQGKGKRMLHKDISEMELTRDEMTEWTTQLASTLFRVYDSQQIGESPLPEDIRCDLKVLIDAQKLDGEDNRKMANALRLGIDDKRMMELLLCCVVEIGKLDIAEGILQFPEGDPESKTKEVTEPDTASTILSAKALQKLKAMGHLSEDWQKIPDEKIAPLLHFVRNDQTIHKSPELILENLTDAMIGQTIATQAQAKENREEKAMALTEDDKRERHLLAIAAMLNLKATGKLPPEMADASDEQLAAMAYTATELNFYFNEATANDMTWDDFFKIAGDLIVAAIFGVLGFCCVFPYYDPLCTIIGSFLLLISVIYIAEAVDIFLTKMFPYGVEETRMGIVVKAASREIQDFASHKVNLCKDYVSDKLRPVLDWFNACLNGQQSDTEAETDWIVTDETEIENDETETEDDEAETEDDETEYE